MCSSFTYLCFEQHADVLSAEWSVITVSTSNGWCRSWRNFWVETVDKRATVGISFDFDITVVCWYPVYAFKLKSKSYCLLGANVLAKYVHFDYPPFQILQSSKRNIPNIRLPSTWFRYSTGHIFSSRLSTHGRSPSTFKRNDGTPNAGNNSFTPNSSGSVCALTIATDNTAQCVVQWYIGIGSTTRGKSD